MSDIDISAEELRQRKYSHSTTPDTDRARCPECGAVGPRPKVSETPHDHDHDADWECDKCHAHFNEPLRDDGGSE